MVVEAVSFCKRRQKKQRRETKKKGDIKTGDKKETTETKETKQIKETTETTETKETKETTSEGDSIMQPALFMLHIIQRRPKGDSKAANVWGVRTPQIYIYI